MSSPNDQPDFRAALKQLADAVDGWEMEPAEDDPLAVAMDRARKVLFPRLASLMQEPTAFELGDLPPPVAAKPVNLAELHDPDFSDGLTPSQHLDVLRGGPDPRADQTEGPSLDDVAELCKEFGFLPVNNGALLAADVFRAPPLSPLPMLRDMITAAITRWHAPVAQPAAQPVNVASLMRLTEGVDPYAPGDPDVDHILALAAIIRKVDGKHDLGAAALAEAILAHPDFSGCHDGPAALPAPAQGEVDELIAALEADAECVAAEQPDLMQLTDKPLTRIAELLKARPALLAPGFQIGPQEYIPHA
jgi:hypothetical protein